MADDHSLTPYLLVVDTTQKSLDDIIEAVDKAPGVLNWYKFMPGAAVVVMDRDLSEANKAVRLLLPRQRFLLVRLEKGAKNGWLPRQAWDFMNAPSAA